MVVFSSSGQTVVNVIIGMSVVAVVALILRMIAKARIRKFAAEDVLIVLGFLGYCAYVGVLVNTLIQAGGTLQPTEAQTLDEANEILQGTYINELIMTFTITMIKLSILVFYRKIFSTKGFRNASIVIGVLCIMWWIFFSFLQAFQCTPVSTEWDLESQLDPSTSPCLSIGKIIFAYEMTNAALDIAIIALPLNKLRQLQLPVERKAVIGVLIVLGSFIVVVCMIRIPTIYSTDPTSIPDVGRAFNWATVEITVAILCACLPCYGPLVSLGAFARVLNSWYSSLLSGRRSSQNRSIKLSNKISSEQSSGPKQETYEHNYDDRRNLTKPPKIYEEV